MVNAGATLHGGYSLYVRCFFFLLDVYSLNFEFRESLDNSYVNAKYNLHKCEEQLSQCFFLFTSAVILLGTSGLLG